MLFRSNYLGFAAIRVYALQRSLILCGIVFILSAVPTVVNFVRNIGHSMFSCVLQMLRHRQLEFRFGLTGENVSPFGCVEVSAETAALTRKLVVALSTSIMILC